MVALAKKVMAADKVLHEQQLGLKWRGPDEEVRSGRALDTCAACAWRVHSGHISQNTRTASLAGIIMKLESTRPASTIKSTKPS